MSAFIYGVALQWKLDIRNRTMLITCYVVPLLFFAVMGGVFSSVNPDAKDTLIQSMSVMGVSMGALIGLPPSLVALYGSDIKKVYKANGVPLYLGLVSMYLSAFIHLLIMSAIIYITAPLAFDASLPPNPPLYFASLAIFIAVSLGVGSILGLLIKNQAKLTMLEQLLFLPSILLSGIMFPVNMLPRILEIAGKIFPASWGYIIMTKDSLYADDLMPLLAILLVSGILCGLLIKRMEAE